MLRFGYKDSRSHKPLRTSDDPVKATLSMLGCSEMAAPAVGPYPGTMFTTPGGKPA